MEALPKLPLLSFELKQCTEPTQFGPKLKQYIAELYHEDPESYNNEIYQLEGLRSSAVRPSQDATGLKAVKRYYCQLAALQTRFPMAKGQAAAVSFTWKDLYEKVSCTLPDIRFEMACILYNIGALHTLLGSKEPRTSPDSLKSACTHYQSAAWVFQYLRDHYPQPVGVDLSVEILRFMQEVCFAQAQECILEKSIADNKKSSVIGAVGKQVLMYYKNSDTYLGPAGGTDTLYDTMTSKFYKPLHNYITFKQAYIECLVCLYQGMNAEEQQKMGERVAFYQASATQLAAAKKLTKSLSPTEIYDEALTFLNDVVEAKKKAAKNENEFIYHEEVPDKDLLSNLKPVSLVKALPINFSDPEISCDVFSRLVPMGAHEASSMYSEEKAKLLRQVIEMVDAKNTDLTEFMSSLQLDHLDYLDHIESKLPQEIVDRCAAMNAKSEIIQTLTDSMNNLAEIISNVEHSLSDVKELIQEETSKEQEYQKVMGARPPSIVCTDLSREANKYQEAHNRTTESNQVLHKAMILHLANLRLLALPLEELEQKIPSVETIEGLDRPIMMEMKRVLGKCREMQSQREMLVQQLRDAINSDDITPILLTKAGEPLTELFQQEIDKHNAKVKIIEQNLAAQENIINKLTSVYASYGESRRLLTDVIRKREALINALITSYDTHEDLLLKSQKGLEFYRKLLSSVNQLLTRVKSTCQVQNEERTQLLSKQNKAALPASVKRDSPSPAPSPPVNEGNAPKLKDYMPYMKSRLANRMTQPAPVESIPADIPYPESSYPTSLRPAPVGSETNIDPPSTNYCDGYNQIYSQQQQNYSNPYQYNQSNPYSTQAGAYQTYNEGKTADAKDVYANANNPAINYNAGLPYAPSQHQNIASDYYHPQISTQDNQTVTPQATNYAAANYSYGQYAYSPQGGINYPPEQQPNTIPSQQNTQLFYQNQQLPTNLQQILPTNIPGSEIVSPSFSSNSEESQNVLNSYMAQMQISQQSNQGYAKPSEHVAYPVDYSQTYYSSNSHQVIPQQSRPTNSIAVMPDSYSPASQNYSSSYPYGQAQPNYAESVDSRGSANSTPSTYNYGNQPQASYMNYNQNVSQVAPQPIDPAMQQYNMQAYDTSRLSTPSVVEEPIRSHAENNQLPTQTAQNYYKNQESIEASYSSPAYSPAVSTGENQNYQSYSNHPGYSYNAATGTYEYNYGYQSTVNTTTVGNQQQWPTSTYTSAGLHETIQSPSGSIAGDMNIENKENYYHTPYGYQTQANVSHQGYDVQQNETIAQTNYGADSNQATYIQSTNVNNTASTYSSNSEQVKVSVTQNEIEAPQEQTVHQPVEEVQPEPITPITEEPSAIDLLSGLDFNIDTKPLTPEIKVPPISEVQVRKVPPKLDDNPSFKATAEKDIVRPPKVVLFSDAVLLNRFTQEVQKLKQTVEGLTNKFQDGVVLLDSKWKTLNEHQIKQFSKKSKRIATANTKDNILTAVVPYDDSRVLLKAFPDSYINASFYEQLSSWCMPLVISNIPQEKENLLFWTAVVEYKINAIVCLMSEMELQGASYWPTAKGVILSLGELSVKLDDVKCNVHWTERKLTVTKGKNIVMVTHYQVNVFPAKVVCGPLVLLADKVLSLTYEGKSADNLGAALVQCSTGGGRSSLFSLVLAAMCQVKAGQIQLCGTLESSCLKLYEHRYNALEDTKYLADAYITVLYYAQGVLCSGTTAFNGEAVVVQSGAAISPTSVTSAMSSSQSESRDKLHKFSRESFEEMKQTAGLKTGDMNDPLSFLDPLWSLKKK